MMEISFGLEPVLLFVAALAAAVVTHFSYRHTTPRLSVGRRWVLGSLRFISLAVIIFLLFEPLLARLSAVSEDPVIAVLLDTSESMQMEDPDGTLPAPETQARDLLQRLPGAVAADLRYFAFDSRVAGLDPEDPATDSVAFDGQRTDIAGAIEYVRTDLAATNLAGVVLISDGRYTAGRNPRHTAGESDVPIYTVVLGDSTTRRDVRISRVTTNEITYTDSALPVQIGIAATGYSGQNVAVSLAVGDSTVGTTRLQLPAEGAEREASLSFIPTKPGLLQLRVRVTGLEGEATFRNNVYTTAVRVLDRRRRILLIGGGPDPDVAAMRQILTADANNEVSVAIQRGSSGFYGGGLPSSLQEIDVLLLAGFPASGARTPDVRRIAEAIAGGKPALFVLSRLTDMRRFEQELSPVFGTSVSPRRRSFYEAVLIPTVAGRRHPVLNDISPVDAWLTLPPVSTSEAPWEVAPDARVLATARVRGVDLRDPLLAVRSLGGNRTALFLGAGTWRLANLPEELSDYQTFWPDLLGNLIQWVSATEDDRAVRVRTTENEIAGGDPVTFVGQVYDESLEPVSDADVSVVVSAPSGDEYRYTMESIGNGRYVLDAGPLDEGTYRYRATGVREGAELGEDTGIFAVGNLALEFRNPVADPLLMRQIALRSGGTSLTPETFDRLSGLLASGGRLEPRVSEARSELELWRQPLFLLVVIVSLATEWVLRKRSGLS